MNIPTTLLVHTADVEPYEGTGAYGEVYGASFPLQCFAEEATRLVRAPNGDQVVSSLTLYCAPGQSAAVPAGSRVTRNGRTTTVILSADRDDAGMGAPQHTEVVCE